MGAVMKISFVTPHFGYIAGGAEVNDLNLGKALESMGHTVSYFYAYDQRLPLVDQARNVVSHLVGMRYWYGFADRAPGIAGKVLRHLFEHYL